MFSLFATVETLLTDDNLVELRGFYTTTDIYLWACFFFVSITLVEYAFLNYYTIVIPRTKNESAAVNKNFSIFNFPTLQFDRRNDVICGSAKVEILNVSDQSPEPIDDNANACILFGRPMNSLMIDKYFRVMYATTFLLFNSIYWPYYQWLSSLHESGAEHD